jgi:ubiquinone/menaquinone biosynthesis C-methylase UbiE
MGRWSQLMAPMLLEFANVTDGEHVLDLGSGTGSLSITVAARLPHCHVVGLEREYVAYAQARVRNRNVQFQVGTAKKLPFSDAQFDASLSLPVFNFLPDPLGTLRELRRVTRPGGRICAATWDYGDGMQMLRLFWDAAVALDSDAR